MSDPITTPNLAPIPQDFIQEYIDRMQAIANRIDPHGKNEFSSVAYLRTRIAVLSDLLKVYREDDGTGDGTLYVKGIR